MMKLVFSIILGFVAGVEASPEGIYSGNSLQPVGLEQALAGVRPGTVVIIGENHGLSVHQRQQLQVMAELRAMGHKVSVGLEFFHYIYQNQVDLYRNGQLPEEEFLKLVDWRLPEFSFYRDQALFPNLAEGAMTVAINAPRFLTTKVGKEGLESLSGEEKAFLPPAFSLGRDSYKQRFVESVPHPLPPEKMNRFFAAQSIWDDTMAWQAKNFIEAHPEQVLVIVVGEFHVQYGGGLPDRMKARGISSVITFSQIATDEIPDDQLADLLAPSPRDGVRADYLWLASTKEKSSP